MTVYVLLTDCDGEVAVAGVFARIEDARRERDHITEQRGPDSLVRTSRHPTYIRAIESWDVA